jgi:hypothetical protein
MKFCVGLVGIALLAASTAATAQDMNLMMAMHDQCQGDVQKICSTVPQNPNAIVGCLATNKAKLTSGCREVTEKVLLAMPGLAPASSEPSATVQSDSAPAPAPMVAAPSASGVTPSVPAPQTPSTTSKKKRRTRR